MRHTDRQTHTHTETDGHINIMTLPGLGAKPSENVHHSIMVGLWPGCTGEIWTADIKIFVSSNRHSPKETYILTMLKIARRVRYQILVNP